MRVIAGKYRNRSLRTGNHFRPTTDRVRETLFNILQTEIPGSVFVDAFAGSGSVGIEALSRGAEMVYFLENNRRVLSILEANLQACSEQDKWRIFTVPVIKGLSLVSEDNPQVDILFFDPPYDFDHYPEVLEHSIQLFPEALHILETSSRVSFKLPDSASLVQERKIGETLLTFYRKA
jgi:16S rRNA (guanine966-N2)-methyltransferase